jgi:hypothetical protein
MREIAINNEHGSGRGFGLFSLVPSLAGIEADRRDVWVNVSLKLSVLWNSVSSIGILLTVFVIHIRSMGDQYLASAL